MTQQEIIREIAKQEGKKVQAPVGNIREIYKIICRLMVENDDVHSAMIANGRRQINAKKKKKK